MNRLFFCLSFAAMWVITFATDFTGYWKGEVMGLPIVFHITQDANNTSTTLSSPSQGAFEIPCDQTIITSDTIHIKHSSLGIEYCGTMQADPKSISGTFIQGAPFKMTLTPSTAEAAMPPRPQTPKPPFIYNSREVLFTNNGITLSGTLTTPTWNFGKSTPAVVLVTGSGVQNRDEEIMGHKPFAVIADYLTRAGIAVLRYDDRGVGNSSPGSPDDNTLNYATDAIAALKFLKQQSGIDTTKVGILGHSEGGSIALIVAATQPKDVAFAISLAGVAVKGRDAMIEQNRMIAQAMGKPMTAEIEQSITTLFNAIDSIQEVNTLANTIREILTKAEQHSPQQIEQSVSVMTSPWYTAFIRLDMAQYLPLVKCPTLALNGEWDIQVSASQNLKAIGQAIRGAITKEYPGLNHMFQESSSISSSLSYGSIQQTISPQVLSDITKFILNLP